MVLTAASSWPNARLGITVSSKVGNAVVRNRVKRIVREVVRNLWRDIEAPGDVVIIAKLDAAKTTHVHAATQLRRALGIRNP